MSQTILKTQELTIVIGKQFDSPVVSEINFALQKGQCLGLVGESGSGKSLTSLATLQLLPLSSRVESSSKIFLDNTNLLELSERNMRAIRGRRIGIIFQDAMSAFNPVLTIEQQLREIFKLQRGLARSKIYSAMCELLTEVGINEVDRCLKSYPHQLSGGMLQRAMIAMVLGGKPEIVIADEPTTSLDVTLQAQILKMLQRLQNQYGMTLLFISHNLAIVQQLADHIIVLRKGICVEAAPAKQFFQHPQDPYSQQLLEATLPTKNFQIPVTPQIPLLTVENLQVHFPIRKGLFKKIIGYVPAVDNISFQVMQGETMALIGESGSGKTTSGKALMRLISHVRGSIRYENQDLVALSKREMRRFRAKLQMIFQNPYAALNPRILIADSIIEGMRAQRLIKSRKKGLQEVDRLLQLVQLSPTMKWRYPHEFSGGERQRICIARALAMQPRLLILDEPTSALDLTSQKQILDLLLQLQQELGLTYLLITHDMAVVAYMAHQVAVMHNGKIVEQGEVQKILEQPQDDYTKRLLSAVPWLQVRGAATEFD